MSRVLICGADGSDESLDAAEVAGRLARRLRGQLVVGQALERPRAFPYGELEGVERRWRRAGGDADDLFERVAERAREPGIEARVVHGHPTEALAELAEQEDAALLVVGSRGRGPAKAALLGSTSLSLASKAGRPVVIVPPGAKEDGAVGRAGPIVCGVDGSEPAPAAAVIASELASVLGTELVLMHVYEPFPAVMAVAPPPAVPPVADHVRLKQRQRRRAESVLETVAHALGARQRMRTVAKAGDPISVLAEAARGYAAEMIVVGTHGRSRLAAALLGSTSAQVVAAAPTPVVVVPDGAEHRFKKQLSTLATSD